MQLIKTDEYTSTVILAHKLIQKIAELRQNSELWWAHSYSNM